MTLADTLPTGPRKRAGPMMRLVASRRFQSIVAATPLLRRIAKRDGEALFDIVAGFVHSQVLWSVVELRLLHHLMENGPLSADALSRMAGLSPERMTLLCDAAASLGLMRRRKDTYAIARKGAALLGVPGLEAMVSHHAVLYCDLSSPVDTLRGAETDLSRFWPYVFGAGAAQDPETAQRYSRLMSDTQSLVAEETLRRIDLRGAREVLDVGGGTGAFLSALGAQSAGPRLHLFDLPAVAPLGAERLEADGFRDRIKVTPGSFRDDPIPQGADVITLVRVLYDHADETVLALLRKVLAALPDGGQLVISEPMKGDQTPTRSGDAYFAFYCMAMGTGRARRPSEIMALLRQAGFTDVEDHGSSRPFVTTVLSARKRPN